VFNWFRKKDWRNSPPHLLLLSHFINKSLPCDYFDPGKWEGVLKESPAKAIERFVSEGMLRPAQIHELMDYKFKLSELKLLLKEWGLKTSGSKGELINRLIEHDKKSVCEMTKDVAIFCCAEEGAALASHYLEGESATRNNIQKNMIDLLLKQDFAAAVRCVVDYESTQIFPRDIEIGGGRCNVKTSAEYIEEIFQKKPKILDGIDVEGLEKIRVAAAMMTLWAGKSASAWLPGNFSTGIHLDGEVAVRMLISHCNHIRNMESCRSGPFELFEIIGSNQNACDACKKIIGKMYKFHDVPELPFPKCTCLIGCRCMAVAKYHEV
jgi:hypothetical protein